MWRTDWNGRNCLNRKEFIDNVRVIDGVFNKIDIKIPIWMKLKQSGMYDTELY